VEVVAELVAELLVLADVVELPVELLPEGAAEPPVPALAPDGEFGRAGPRLGAMSLLIRLKRARTRRLCSTASRPAWA
jgi:hypothetical protein